MFHGRFFLAFLSISGALVCTYVIANTTLGKAELRSTFTLAITTLMIVQVLLVRLQWRKIDNKELYFIQTLMLFIFALQWFLLIYFETN
jgi:Na+/melibiose symporter-like transporter